MGRPRATRLRATRPLAALFGLLALALIGGDTRAQGLVADLSDHLIAISTAFTGREVVLFGALDGPGEVAVVVMGPEESMVVRRKDRTLGLWVNAASMEFTRVPSYYAVATSVPLDRLADATTLARHRIGLGNLRLDPADPADAGTDNYVEFRDALIRTKQTEGLYSAGGEGSDTNAIARLGPQLFRTNIYFPANVPTGQYTVSVFLFREGQMVSAQTTPLFVNKIGVGARVFTFAQTQAAAYGGIAILMAVAAGWLAGVVFRRT